MLINEFLVGQDGFGVKGSTGIYSIFHIFKLYLLNGFANSIIKIIPIIVATMGMEGPPITVGGYYIGHLTRYH